MMNLVPRVLKDLLQGKAVKGKKRSGKWRRIRREHLKREPACVVCCGRKSLEVHHIVPFSVNPDLELVPSNLMTLCESKRLGLTCHQLIGHLGNYRRQNPDVRTDAKTWRNKLRPGK